MVVPSKYRALGERSIQRAGNSIVPLVALGHQFAFAYHVLRAVPRTLHRYRRQIGVVFMDIGWGNGRVIVGGGTVGVVVFMGLMTGSMIGIEAFRLLDMLGMGPLTGFISSFANTRELAPLIAAIAFAAQAGCRITAEVGAMRISEEIDALEASAVEPIPFVVTTRVIAGVLIVIPVYLASLACSYFATAFFIKVIHGQAGGTYDHYFEAFLNPADIVRSLVKAIVFVVVVILVHSYYGYYASGGPEGVGVASGRAIRASLVLIIILDLTLTTALWGMFVSDIRITG
ncbi:ABC transporter permease [Nocardia sp. 2]|uniref:ABC transporter permease n=1 Tax=Nocardia acididurans TaxID=2802282 RepID=A0ABS1ME70_9NOCA|nr:ABC transporter permease [Nocardia acididurans]MBL1078946.1 ABC transporter permease [Nocardia acididurans]